MTETLSDQFKEAVERYKAGEEVTALIPVFQEICDRAPKSSAAWTCLAWLHLLTDASNSAYKAAQKAVKLQPHDAQARVNLALAMLDSGQSGVRPHIEQAMQLIMIDADIRDEIKENIEDGFKRKPEWKSLQRVKNWLFESSA